MSHVMNEARPFWTAMAEFQQGAAAKDSEAKRRALDELEGHAAHGGGTLRARAAAFLDIHRPNWRAEPAADTPTAEPTLRLEIPLALAGPVLEALAAAQADRAARIW